MARQLNVNLVFSANTASAQANIQKLQTSLTQLTTQMATGKTPLGLTQELANANTQVASLKANLAQATNATTGKLDLTKFNAGLQASGLKLSDYRKTLQSLGPEGQKAFSNLTQAIVQGQTPLQKTNGLLGSIMNTFTNTAKWMLASSVLRGITSSFQEAFQYAEDLNKSLTNIRIVTGKSMEEMKEFAEYANKAAKALSATTTAYTDAALIYYQQGLSGEEVYKRAEATLKLANVTGESAEQVSQWMTAIWNNFDDGTETLEYYADVITALGAATASSSKEIADGLEKFAAVAETVGLSYEYATTALATITAETRQSADVVGTALKTLFARIQGLKLGETLDDGTTLNKYSEALYAVGINIKDANGELKDMDIILNEMGTKWDSLGKAEQVALAQSVAGIRQYTQLIALMDNWDTFKINLDVAEGSEGALQEQQEIWAESWEAAQKRVKTSSEELYNELINDKFFIDLNNIFANLIDTFTEMVKAMGGLKTLLPMLAGLMMKAFGPSILNAITNLKYGFESTGVKAQNTANQLRAEALKQQGKMAGSTDSLEGSAMAGSAERKLKLYESIEGITRNLSKKEQEVLQFYVQQEEELSEILQLSAQIADQASQKLENAKATRYQGMADEAQGRKEAQEYRANLSKTFVGTPNASHLNGILSGAGTQISQVTNAQNYVNSFVESDFQNENGFDVKGAQDAAKNLLNNRVTANSLDAGTKTALTEFTNNKTATDQDAKAIQELLSKLDLVKQKSTEVKEKLKEAFNQAGIKGADKDINGYVNGLEKASKGANAVATANRNIEKAQKNATAASETFTKSQDTANKQIQEWIKRAKAMSKVPLGQTIMGIASGFGMLAGGLNGVTNGLNSVKQMFESGEHSITGWLGALSGIAMSIPMVVMGFQQFSSVLGITNAQTAVATALEKNLEKEKRDMAVLQALGITLKKGETTADLSSVSAKMGLAAAEKFANGEKKKGIGLAIAAKAAHLLEAIGLGSLIPVKYADAAASGTAGAATMAMVWPIGILVAAIAVLVIAVVGLIAIFKALSNAYNADAIAADKARKTANALRDAYNETKEAYNNLIEALEKRTTALDTLQSLTKGTTEWRQALMDVNAQTMELLKKYPELQKYSSVNADGLIEISKAGQDFIKEKEAEQLQTNYQAMISGQMASKAADAKANKTKLTREIWDTDVGNAWAGAGANALASIGMGVSLPVIGQVLTVLAGAATGLNIMAQTAKATVGKEDTEALLAAMRKDEDLASKIATVNSLDEFTKIVNQYGITSSSVIDALYANRDKLNEIINQEKMVEIAQRDAAKQITTTIIEEMGYSEDKNAGAITELATNIYTKQEKELYDQYYKALTDRGAFNTKTNLSSAAFEEYAKIAGLSDLNGFKVTNFKGDGSIEYSYIDEENNEQTKTATAEEMATVLASNSASAIVEDKIQQLSLKFHGQDQDTVNNIATLASGISGNINLEDTKSSIYDQLDKVGLGPEDIVDGWENLSSPQAKQEAYDAALASYGIDISAMDKARNDARLQISENIDKMEELSGGTPQSLNVFAMQNTMTADQGQRFTTALEDLTNFYTIDSGIGGAITNATAETGALMGDSADEFYDKVSQIENMADSSQWDALADQMKASGELTVEQVKALDAYVETAKAAAKATKAIDLGKLTDSLKALNNSIDKAKSGDMNFSQEEYDQMIANGMDESMFAKTLDGFRYLGDSAQLVADSVNAQQKLTDQAQADYENSVFQYQQAQVNSEAAIAALEAEQGETIEATEQLKSIWSIICDFFVGIGEAFGGWLSDIWNGICEFFLMIWDGVVGIWNMLVSAWNSIIKGIAGLLEAIGVNWEYETLIVEKAKTSEQLAKEQAAKEAIKKENEAKVLMEQNHQANLDRIEMSADTNNMQQIQSEAAQAKANLEAAKKAGAPEDEIKRLEEIVEAYDKAIKSRTQKEKMLLSEVELLVTEEEIDQYISLREAIGDVEEELDRLATLKEEAYGPKKIKLIQAEIKETQKLLKLKETEEKMLRQDVANSRSNLLSQFQADFSDKGIINNAAAIEKSLVEAINYARRENAIGIYTDKQVEDAEKRLENFRALRDKYYEDLNNQQALELEQLELSIKEANQQLETVTETVTYNIDINTDDIEFLDFLLNSVEDESFKAAENIKYLTDKIVELQDNVKIYEQGITEIMQNAAGRDLTASEIEQLKNYRSELLNTYEEMSDVHKQITETITTELEDWNNRFETNTNILERQQGVLEHYQNLIELNGQETLKISNDTMVAIARSNVDTAQVIAINAKNQLEANRAALEQIKLAKEQAVMEGNEKAVQSYDKLIQDTEEQIRDLEATFEESQIGIAESITAMFEVQVNSIVKDFEKAMSGIYSTLQDLSDMFEKQLEISHLYLSNYEKTYEINKLNRKVTESIDKTESIKAQKELKELQKELTALNKEGAQVSKADIDLLEKKYNLMLAEQALKEAQNAKNQVTLRRDSQGNYNYVYTANQSNIDATTQQYDDAVYAMEQFSEKILEEAQKNIIQLQSEFAQAEQEILSRTDLTTTEQTKLIDELYSQYSAKIEFYEKQINNFLNEGNKLNTQYNLNLADSFNDTLLKKMMPDLNTFEDFCTKSYTAMKTAVDNFKSAIIEKEKTTKAAYDAIDLKLDELEPNITSHLSTINNTTNAITTESGKLKEGMTGAFAAIATAAKTFDSQFSLSNTKTQLTEIIKQLDEFMEKHGLVSEYKVEEESGDPNTDNSTGTITGNEKSNTKPTTESIEPKPNPKPYVPDIEKGDPNKLWTFKKVVKGIYAGKNPWDGSWYLFDYKEIDNAQNPTRDINNERGLSYEPTETSFLKAGQTVMLDPASRRLGITFYEQDGTMSNQQLNCEPTDSGSFVLDRDYGANDIVYFPQNSTLGNLYNSLGVLAYSLVPTFDTGGYTGSWGPEGRMAMLHQKEIVLNAHDTENLLTVVGIVRSMVDQLEANTKLASYGLGQLTARTIGVSSDTLQQEVTIHAEFPNATDHNEIEEAFRNLTNLASQYANRK